MKSVMIINEHVGDFRDDTISYHQLQCVLNHLICYLNASLKLAMKSSDH